MADTCLCLRTSSDYRDLPATVRLDLVFPWNETYALDALLPIVIAVQNPEAAGLLAFYSDYFQGYSDA